MKFFRDLFLAAITSLLVMLLLDGGLQLAGVRYTGSFFQAEAERGYSLRPNAEGWNRDENETYLRINSDGMRDRERPVARPRGVLRIALLGSSETEARMVPLDKIFPSVLERNLHRALGLRGTDVDVLNFAVPGYAFSQQYLTLEHEVWRYDPQIIILVVHMLSMLKNTRETYPQDPFGTPFYVLENGVLQPDAITRATPPPDPRKVHWKNAVSDWMNRSALASMVNQAIRNDLPEQPQLFAELFTGKKTAAAQSAFQTDDFGPLTFVPDLPETQKAWAIGEAFLDSMRQACARRGVEFWIVIADQNMQTHPNLAERARYRAEKQIPSLDAADERIERFGASHGIPVVALAKPLGEYAAAHGVALHGFPLTPFNYGHWNELGHQLVGNVLAQELLTRSAVVRNWTAGN